MLLRQESLNFLNNFRTRHATSRMGNESDANWGSTQSQSVVGSFFFLLPLPSKIDTEIICHEKISRNKEYAERSWYAFSSLKKIRGLCSRNLDINCNDRYNENRLQRICRWNYGPFSDISNTLFDVSSLWNYFLRLLLNAITINKILIQIKL